VIGKYVKHKDAYISLFQAILHAGFVNDTQIDIDWIDADNDVKINKDEISGIIVPGGFGNRGTNAKIKMIQYARENNIPFLGICLGMQLAVIEACRNIAFVHDATSREFDENGAIVVDFMKNWMSGSQECVKNPESEKRGTMRLGNYECFIEDGTLASRIYGANKIVERHRHRYEVNFREYRDLFDRCGIIFSGKSIDGKLPEIMERKDHPFFIAVQFHPEFKSRPFSAHPLFREFIKKATEL
jgi:CTP synthase